MVMTMRGAVACEDSSVTWVLPHEHLIHNINANLGSDSDERERSVGSTIEDIRPDQLHELRVNPAASGINLVIDREDEIFREIELLESHSLHRGIIIDVTTKKEGRDVVKLQRVSKRVGIHIVASTGFDTEEATTWPSTLTQEEKAERLAESLETELMFGVGENQSQGCAGVIYQQVHLTDEAHAPLDAVLIRGFAMVRIMRKGMHSE